MSPGLLIFLEKLLEIKIIILNKVPPDKKSAFLRYARQILSNITIQKNALEQKHRKRNV